jgi:lysozyme
MVNSVIDLSHHNTLTASAFHEMVEGNIVGVIHKATQGRSMVDQTYSVREKRARSVGILWGAYHFLVRGVPVEKQVRHFLSLVDPETTLLALDFETNAITGTTPTLEEAHDFIEAIYAETSIYPVFYSGHTVKEALGKKKDALLGKCPLWWAQYGPRAVIQESWNDWTLWQYTGDGIGNEPHGAPGVKGNVDRNLFQGSEADLRKWWIAQLAPHEEHALMADGVH